ncbi:acyl-CoA dehydrogenase family protein [Lipingzhangella sp. LS1_29]|uniref:Acyl-CoA dehydrogenase family protein n=1 Tax=Lipingzhangella rawalii TaxID=2055835 RepID=A0ABU2HB23_9ACTN|nr:acyl-CoA dehydrogenase family protein [Lipingzhangella rawalii]MDS1272463.1 acyl-CoA dehydrogenase family protein [Lipingzhangella rawalii]
MISETVEQTEVRAELAQCGEELSTGHLARDESAEFAWDQWQLLRKARLFGLPFDPQWGGRGHSLLTTMHALESLGEHCRDSGLSFSATTTMASTGIPLHRFGTTAQQEKYLPRICSGEAIGAHAITEPDSGSDALAMHTHAHRDGDEFVLTGSKTFVTNGPVADVFVVYARTHPDGGALGITAFLVDRATPGLAVGPALPKMGLRTSPLGELSFDNCRIPSDQVLGRVGGGFLVLDFVMQREILLTFAVTTGEMRHRLARCVEYARTRRSFGRPIGSHQSVSNQIVDMKIRTETARKWIFDTGARLAAGKDVTTDLAISKTIASENNMATSLAAVNVFGGHGYLTEQGLEKGVRDAVGGTIYSGTNEIQYNRIASALGLSP